MAIEVKHATQATGTDAGNGEIRKAEWNEAHAINLAAGRLLGRYSATDGAAQEISVGSGLSLDTSTGVLSATGGGGGGYTYSALEYTYTGTLFVEPIVTLSTPFPAQTGGTVGSQSGVWALTLLLSQANYQLTEFEFTNLSGVSANFSPSNIPLLTTLSLPSLTTVGVNFQPTAMAALTTLSLPSLTTVGGQFNPGSLGITTLSLPSLTTVGSTFSPNSMALTTLSLPSLTTVGGNFSPAAISALTTLSLPALTITGGQFQPSNMAALTTISLPSIVNIEPSRTAAANSVALITGTPALSSFTFGSTLKRIGATAGNVTFTSCALDQASVDGILVSLAALDGTNGTTSFNNRTVTITGTSAAPSATGLAAKATLVARGCTVTHR